MSMTLSAQIKWVTNLDDFKKQIQAGTDGIVAHTATVDRLTRSLSGQGLIAAVHNYAAAVEKMGGVEKLTAAEKLRINTLVEKALTKYSALGQQAPAALQRLADATRAAHTPVSRLNALLGDMGTQIAATAAGFLSAQAILGAVRSAWRALTEFVTSSIASYAKQEAAVRKMTTALVAQGQATPRVIQQYAAMAAQFQRTTVHGDELINEMQALLTQVGNVMPSQMDKALQAATNLSSGLGVDLRQATMLVGKAFEGETGTLKRYGIVIDEAKLKAEGIGAVLDAIQAKFGGQAQSEVETYAGKVKQLANAWDDFKEAIGKSIVEAPELQLALKLMTDRLNAANASAEQGQSSWQGWWKWAAGGPAGLLLKAAQVALRSQAKEILDFDAMVKRALQSAPALPSANQGGGQFTPPPFDAAAWLRQQEAMDAARKKAAEALKKEITETTKLFEVHKQYIATQKTTVVELDKYIAGMDRSIARAAAFRIETAQMDVVFKQLAFGLPVVAGLGKEWEKVGKVSIPEIPKAIKLAKVELDDLAQSLAQLAQISRGTFGAVAQGLATMVASLDAANKSLKTFKDGQAAFKDGETMNGILGMASGIAGIVTAAIAAAQAIKAIWNAFDRNKGRDLVKDFAASFGGFDALHAKLLTLGDAGEQLWIRLTQGVGRNDQEGARAAIAAVTAALAGLDSMTVDVPIRFDVPDVGAGGIDGGDFPGESFHRGTGKVLAWPRLHSGLSPDEVPAILQTGEAVLNRRAAAALGSGAVDALNRGDRPGGGGTTVVNIQIDRPILKDRQAMRELTEEIARELPAALKRRGAA